MLNFFSRVRAYLISRSLRAVDRSVAAAMADESSFCRPASMSTLRTYCWVRVEAPWEPPLALETTARMMPAGSTPLCW